MTTRPTKNVADSVRQRLLNLAKVRGEEFNLFLARYAVERFLYRLSRSKHRDTFVLKGATFKRRGTAIPQTAPIALTTEFADDAAKKAQWRAFAARDRLSDADATLDDVVTRVEAFLTEPLAAARDARSWAATRPPGRPWHRGRRVPSGR